MNDNENDIVAAENPEISFDKQETDVGSDSERNSIQNDSIISEEKPGLRTIHAIFVNEKSIFTLSEHNIIEGILSKLKALELEENDFVAEDLNRPYAFAEMIFDVPCETEDDRRDVDEILDALFQEAFTGQNLFGEHPNPHWKAALSDTDAQNFSNHVNILKEQLAAIQAAPGIFDQMYVENNSKEMIGESEIDDEENEMDGGLPHRFF